MKQIAGLFLLLVVMMFSAAWLSQGDNSTRVFSRFANPTQILDEKKDEPSDSGLPHTIIGNNKFDTEIVRTEADRKQGLTKYKTIEDDFGMLFVFGREDVRPAFWMKSMSFPIDIIWIDNGKIVQINKDVPVPATGTAENDLPKYEPRQVVDYVFEVGAGVTEKKGIEVGDTVDLPNL